MADLAFFYSVGIALVIVGVLIIIAAIVLVSLGGKRNGEQGEVNATGVIMIGPIPIILGTDKKAVKSVLVLTLTVIVVAAVVLVIYYLLPR